MKRLLIAGLLILSVSLGFLVVGSEASKPAPKPSQPSVGATVETEPVPTAGDAADDIAIWVNPADPSKSTVIGTDKGGGIAVYSLDGRQLQYRADGKINNVDLRYSFPLGDDLVSLVIASNVSSRGVVVYRVEPASRQLVPILQSDELGIAVYGLCMYRSGLSGAFYFFLTEAGTGTVQQWRVASDTSEGIALHLERAFNIGSQSEGCVADDLHGVVYFAEEGVGIWRYGAEPTDQLTRALIDSTGRNGNLTADVEGLALYQASDGAGYLLASSQGNSTYVIYERRTGTHVGTFRIAASGGIDGTEETDGIEVVSAALGPAFPQGVFAAQDGKNTTKGKNTANQNFKLVPWQSIANAFSPPLLISHQ